MNRRIFKIMELNKFVNGVIDSEILLNNVFLRGEVSNYKKHYSGTSYFTLKDENAEIKAVIFKEYMEYIPFHIENGQELVVLGTVQLYEKKGQYQIVVEGAEPLGVGKLKLNFEELKNHLKEKGFFNAEKKKEIPKMPKCVAVITSDTGAVVHDVINIIQKRNEDIKIIVVPTKVQGEGASIEIAKSVYAVNEHGEADVIILGRGGGSEEDLWSFNEEITVEAIFNSKIPIISAVGHETDFTLSDFVADLRASTPTEAGEIVSPLKSEILNRIQTTLDESYKILDKKIGHEGDRVRKLLKEIKYKDTTKCEEHNQIVNRIEENFKRKVENRKEKLSNITKLLEANSPISILNKGYSIVTKEKKVIKNIENVAEGDNVKIELKNGYIQCNVVSRMIKKEKKG